MLNLNELLDVALGERPLEEVRRGTPARYGDDPLPPPVVVWNVCRRCNMTCPHCYAAAGEAPSRFALDRQEALEVADQLVDCGVRAVIFSGGEPLMRPDLLDLIEAVDAGGLPCHLSTNGTLLDASTADALADAGIGYVGVSLDGIAGFNDAYRGLEEGFRRATDGIEHAREAGLRTGLRVTLTRHNVHQLLPLYEHARDIEVDRFYVSHLLDAGRGRAMADADLDRSTCRATLRRLAKWAHPDERDPEDPSVVTGGNDSDGAYLVWWLRRRFGPRAARRAAKLLAERGGNSAGVGLLNIDARGDVHPDQFWRQCTLGNVRKMAFAELLDHPIRRQLRDRVDRLKGRCASCPLVATCQGSHRERALARNDDVWAPDPACLLTDEELSHAPHRQEAEPCAEV